MKKFASLLAVALLALAAVSLGTHSKATAADKLPAQVQKIKDTGVLKVGVKQDVPNFGYYDSKSGKYTGMEVEIAKKIADELGVKVEYTAVTSQTREALLDNGQTDLTIATYTINDERKANYSISNPYYYDQVGFLVNKSDNINSPKDLDGKTIGVAQGSTTKTSLEEYAKSNNLHFKYMQLGSFPELAIALRAFRIDAFSVDKSILTGYVSKNNKILDQGFDTMEYGIAAKKSNDQLTNYINGLLAQWRKDGSLQKIYDKYNLDPADADDE
ncbi:transporter substrate-binding domain-containing protein [Streptococcus dentapri]|uniref:Transporter substrate-binding domain-containing protein n=1 Tax=Streptococcus dentapri TaxID=573564 RepID=A0ABV8CZ76_9STRE